MGKNIKGIIVTPLKIISDDRGSVMHMLRSDSKILIPNIRTNKKLNILLNVIKNMKG